MTAFCRVSWLGTVMLIGSTFLPLSIVCAHETPTASETVKDSTRADVVVRTLPAADSAYTSMLKPPVSRKLRSGYVCLQAGKAGEEHSTENYEEMLVILAGQGELAGGDDAHPLAAGQIAYVPPHTTHFVRNTGKDTLRYLYIVTKVEP